MRSALLLVRVGLPLLLALSSCSSPPKPPTVTESQKRPVNTALAVELQVCKSDLNNTRILAAESERMADSAAASLRQLAARQQAVATLESRMEAPKANALFTVRFAFGSTRVVMPAEMSSALIEEARSAPLVVLKGRTDGVSDSAVESRIARERAIAVRDYLVAANVDASRIRTTYQPAGDHAADNADAVGQALNRRVEIEVYRALPVVVAAMPAVGLAGPAQP